MSIENNNISEKHFQIDTSNTDLNTSQIDDLLSGMWDIRLKEVVANREELWEWQLKATELFGDLDDEQICQYCNVLKENMPLNTIA